MNIWVFLLLTVIIFGGAAFLMGQAIAETWRPAWQNVAYGLLLAVANRFLDGALFKSDWLDLGQYAVVAVSAYVAIRLWFNAQDLHSLMGVAMLWGVLRWLLFWKR